MIGRSVPGLFLLLIVSCAQADRPALSLVVDDLGYSFEQAKEVLSLPGNHTYAIIPGTTYGRRIARYAYQNGREIILHMPMQSATDLVIEESALHDAMDEQEITQRVRSMIDTLPNISGINNHMGSRLTELGYIMRPVMETIKQVKSGLYFLDSRTTPLSTAYEQARFAGLPSIKRDIFLDYDPDNRDAMEFQWQRWLKKSRELGHAVAIAHPYRNTIEFLRDKLESVEPEYHFVTLSEVLQQRPIHEAPTWPRYLSHWQKDSKNSKPLP